MMRAIGVYLQPLPLDEAPFSGILLVFSRC